jgi:hypothetical protein
MKKQLVFGLVAMLALGSGAAFAQTPRPDNGGNGGGGGAGYILAQVRPEDGRNGSNTYHLPECKGMHCPWLLVDGSGNGGGNTNLIPDYPNINLASDLILVGGAGYDGNGGGSGTSN